MAAILATSAVGSLSSLNKASLAPFTASNGSRVYAAANRVVTFAGRNDGGADRPLWFPGVKAPEYLDGTLIGDFGFDPLGLGKPAEYLQFDVDDESQSVFSFGELVGKAESKKEEVSATPFQPYSEVFSLTRFRENEVIHGRWAMLFIVGALSVEAFTGVTWQDAGKVELEQGSSYFGLPLPFSISTLVIIEVLLIGYIEFARNSELDPEKRLYPGGYFDPLGLANDPEKEFEFKQKELANGRLAMISALGFAAQAAATGKGPLDNWATHLADPLHTTIFDTFSS